MSPPTAAVVAPEIEPPTEATASEASAPSFIWLSSTAFSALSFMISIRICRSWMPACRPKLPEPSV